jgi:hypothetical protein
MKSLISGQGRAAWCLTFATFDRAGSVSARCPLQAAGLSPDRNPRAFAKSKIASMRPLNLLAVSGFSFHIGSKAASTCEVEMSETGTSPNTGLA